jgi:hypothetical protein
MKIDHVSIGWSSLKPLQDLFAAAGMSTEYGGPHSSGKTHMSLLGFRDGSYIELISKVKAGSATDVWKEQIDGDGGPCAWCVQSGDIAAEVSKAKSMGIPSSGPVAYTRKRPDGVLVEWDLGFLGEGDPGSTLPFLIKDRTPRGLRVKPSMSVSDSASPLSGVGVVVIAVADLQSASAQFRSLYGWNRMETAGAFIEGSILIRFSETPVVLATPSGPGWVSDRVSRFGSSPCAFLIETDNLEAAEERYSLTPRQPWFGGKELGWVGPLREKGIMLGVVER